MTWPQDPQGAEVATCFVTTTGRVSAALRYPSLEQAREVAALLSEVLAAEAATAAGRTGA